MVILCYTICRRVLRIRDISWRTVLLIIRTVLMQALPQLATLQLLQARKPRQTFPFIDSLRRSYYVTLAYTWKWRPPTAQTQERRQLAMAPLAPGHAWSISDACDVTIARQYCVLLRSNWRWKLSKGTRYLYQTTSTRLRAHSTSNWFQYCGKCDFKETFRIHTMERPTCHPVQGGSQRSRSTYENVPPKEHKLSSLMLQNHGVLINLMDVLCVLASCDLHKLIRE